MSRTLSLMTRANGCRATSEYSRRYPRRTSCKDHAIRSRYAALQYVVQRPEGVRRRQRLNVEYVDRRAGDLLLLQGADQSLLFDDRPARRIDQPGCWLILSSSGRSAAHFS